MGECTICYVDFDNNEPKYTCSEPECQTYTCKECIGMLIGHSKGEELLPTCPATDCHAPYILSELKDLSKNTIKDYNEACLNFMMKDKGDNVKKRMEEAKLIEKLREERLKFLEQTFPKAVTLVAKITFKDRLRKLDKQKSKIIQKKMENASRPCMNVTCSGFLDPNLVCMTCSTEFCKHCEVKLELSHVCKQEDLDSVNLVNNMVHCPGCKLPVFKNEGCDSITCANCRTRFKYSTGEKGGHGSSNAPLKTKVDHRRTNLSESFASIIPENRMKLVLTLEAKRPAVKSKDILLGPIKRYIQTDEKEKCAKQLAKKLDVYTKSKYKNRDYHRYTVEIEGMLRRKEDVKERIEEIINLLDKKTVYIH